MLITFDAVKNGKNIAERGLSFERLADPAWNTALAVEDTRRDYGERWLRVAALLRQRLHIALITMRGDAVHVISFRRANRKVVRLYGQQKRESSLGS